MAEARASNRFGTVNQLAKNLAFNLGGHVNHSVFWPNMSPEGGDKPDGELAAALDEHFGSFDGFRAQFGANALGVQGSGWSVLAWDGTGQRMVLERVCDHQGNLASGTVPLLLLDMWEHAFYLRYRNVKADFVEAWWNVVNWADVERRFRDATSRRCERNPSKISYAVDYPYILRRCGVCCHSWDAGRCSGAPGGAGDVVVGVRRRARRVDRRPCPDGSADQPDHDQCVGRATPG